MIRITSGGGYIGRWYWINSDPGTIRTHDLRRFILWGTVRWDSVLIDLEVQS